MTKEEFVDEIMRLVVRDRNDLSREKVERIVTASFQWAKEQTAVEEMERDSFGEYAPYNQCRQDIEKRWKGLVG